MAALTLQEHLAKIRDGFRKIESLTRLLGEDAGQETLETALRAREVILCSEIENGARQLSAVCPDWLVLAKNDPALQRLLRESEDLMRSIARLDENISVVVNRRMSDVNEKLTTLYHTSRAANSYTRQSKLRVAR